MLKRRKIGSHLGFRYQSSSKPVKWISCFQWLQTLPLWSSNHKGFDLMIRSILTTSSTQFWLLTVLAQAAMTKRYRQGDLNNSTLFLIILEVVSPGSGCQHGQTLMRALSLVCRRGPLAVSSTWQKEDQGARWGLSRKDSNPIQEHTTLMTQSPPKSPPPHTILVGLVFHTRMLSIDTQSLPRSLKK